MRGSNPFERGRKLGDEPCARATGMHSGVGKVYLIGAGPGDPGLLTLKGKEVLGRAQVVVYDFLASEALLGFCRGEAQLICVGKRPGGHTFSQRQINDLLVQKATEGWLVARLKGGDPFVFGRGGEEAEALRQAGIPFEIVPGVTSAVAAPAYAGIPLTHRRYASSVGIVTGHEDPCKPGSRIRWDRLAGGMDTLVFLMGMKNIRGIVEGLTTHGMGLDTPAAIIEWGTTNRQRTLTAPLGEIAGLVSREGLGAPAVLVVGEVVRLRERLAWYESSPLFGKRIVVTRARRQASELVQCLRSLGGEPLELPTIAVREPEAWESLDRALDQIEAYHWLLFTSANAVESFFGRLRARGRDIRDLKGILLGAIGPGTARSLESLCMRVDLTPDEYTAEALLGALARIGVEGKRILIPRALEAREVLPERLRDLGAAVDVAVAYQTVPSGLTSEEVRDLFTQGRVDAITFTSSSTVKNFVGIVGQENLQGLLQGVTVACIGPITASTARGLGISPDVVAKQYTIMGLVEALVDHFRAGSGGDNRAS